MPIVLDDPKHTLPPHHPENFRITYKRARHYVDTLPDCPVAKATDVKHQSVTSVIRRAWPKEYKKGFTFRDGTSETYALDSVRHLDWLRTTDLVAPVSGDEFARAFLSSASEALDAAGDRGTQCHDVFEAIVLGHPVNPGTLAAPYVDSIGAAVADLDRRYGLTGALTERAAFLRDQGIGGTFDLSLPAVMVDLKSRGEGVKLEGKEGERAQLGAYNRADYYIDTMDGVAARVPMRKVSAGALVLVTPTEYAIEEVDMDKAMEAWDLLVECDAVRLRGQQAARKARGKCVAVEVTPKIDPASQGEVDAEAATTAPSTRGPADAPGDPFDGLDDKPTTEEAARTAALARLDTLTPAERDLLVARWPFPCKARDLPLADVGRFVALLDDIARDTGAGFTATEVPTVVAPEPTCTCEKCNPPQQWVRIFTMCPLCGNKRCPKGTDHDLECTNSNEPGQPGSSHVWTRPDEGDDLDDATIAATQAVGKRMPGDCKAWIAARLDEAQRAGRAIEGPTKSVRWLEICRALMNTAITYHDRLDRDPDLVRALFVAATGLHLAEQPGFTLGAAFGSLTIDEARACAALMMEIYDGTKRLGFDEAGRPLAVAA